MIDSTAARIWHFFLESTPKDLRKSLMDSLDPHIATILEDAPSASVDMSQGIEPAEEQLHRIHASWFAPFLRTLPENDIHFFLSCLSNSQVEILQKSLLSASELPHCSPIAIDYLRKTLFYKIAEPSLTPATALPEEPLNALIKLSPTELLSVIELMSMHDLSLEIRQIIETKKLKEIYAVLTKPQLAFLKTLLHKKEAVSFKKMGLASWVGDQESLRSLLLQRGINRLAKSLFGKDPSLIWYISHYLDSEKGKMLLNLCTPLDHAKAAQILSDQVLEIVHAITNHNPLQHP